MSYIGSAPSGEAGTYRNFSDVFSGNGSTTFTLSYNVVRTTDIEVVVNNVQQNPFDGSYSIVNNNILTFSEAPSTSSNNIVISYRNFSKPVNTVGSFNNASYVAANSTIVVETGTGNTYVTLNTGNSTVQGLLKIVDSTSNTDTTIAASAKSVKTAYDQAITSSGDAYTNAASYADTKAATAYSNATSYTDNKAAAAYSNAVAYAASNSYVNSTFAPLAGATFTGAVRFGNSTVYTLANSTAISGNGYNNPALLNTYDGDPWWSYGGFANNTDVFLQARFWGDTTANKGFRILDASTNTVVFKVDSTGTTTANGAGITSVNAATVGGNTAATLRLYADNTAANAYANSVSYTDAKVANLVNAAPAALDTLVELAAALGNDASFSATVTTGIGNAYTNAYNQAVTLSNNAYTNATSYAASIAGTAYSNAISYASNASNISSGTLVTARLPATANVSTAINVGANVNINTTAYAVGNSTVNTFIVATGINTNGTITANTIVVGNVEQTQTNLQVDPAGTAFLNALIYG